MHTWTVQFVLTLFTLLVPLSALSTPNGTPSNSEQGSYSQADSANQDSSAPRISRAMIDKELVEFVNKYQKQIQFLRNSPRFQQIQRKLASPKAKKSMVSLFENADWPLFAVLQVALFVLYLVFRSYMTAKKEKWFAKLWTGTWIFVAYVALSATVIPHYALGPAYFDFVSALAF